MPAPEALVFVLRYWNNRGIAGYGLICPEARYVSALWNTAERIERGSATPAQWDEIEHDISVGLPAARLPAMSAIVRALVGDDRARDTRVQYLVAADLPVDDPTAEILEELDNVLRMHAAGFSYQEAKRNER